jgi:hypothetical protein
MRKDNSSPLSLKRPVFDYSFLHSAFLTSLISSILSKAIVPLRRNMEEISKLAHQ